MDGSARGGLTTSGGVIRDNQGNFIVGFSSFYGSGTNNFAEFLALNEVMLLCKALHLSPILIESDSMFVVTALRLAKMENWRLAYIFRECLQLYTADMEFVHGF